MGILGRGYPKGPRRVIIQWITNEPMTMHCCFFFHFLVYEQHVAFAEPTPGGQESVLVRRISSRPGWHDLDETNNARNKSGIQAGRTGVHDNLRAKER